jgi:RHS repeat-associated protein
MKKRLILNDVDCIMDGTPDVEELGIPFEEIPEQMSATVGTEYGEFFGAMHLVSNAGESPEVYYYHGDHLGSASWITDASGTAVQHLQYLPFGERFVDQRTSGYCERFTFTGKERDEETGYGYFGARYMDYELITMWLSVDPMADKYPSISPYNYCAWNPVKLVDPDGQEYGDYFSSTGVWLGSDGINDGKLYRQVDFTDINSCLRNDYVEVGAPYSYAGTYEYVGNVTNITMDYTGTMAPDKNNNPHIAKGVFTITFHVGDQEFVRGKYEAWSGCNYKDGSVRYPLQNGEWMLANSDRPVSTSQKNSYTRDNACFKIDLSPVGFTTARYGIQIHPDGGANGTAGCIGIRTNPSDFYNAYKSCVSLHPNLKVNVNIKNNPNNNVPR